MQAVREQPVRFDVEGQHSQDVTSVTQQLAMALSHTCSAVMEHYLVSTASIP